MKILLSRFKKAPVSWKEGILAGSVGGILSAFFLPAWIFLFVLLLVVLWSLVIRNDTLKEFKRGKIVQYDGLVFGLSITGAALLALILIRAFVKTPLF